jgi:hypothetical protein
LLGGLAGLTVCGCTAQRIEKRFLQPLEAAHGTDTWPAGQALACDIEVQAGLNPPTHARLVCDWNTQQAAADLADGTRIVFDGCDVWVSPAEAHPVLARDLVVTCPWLVMAPVKLRGPRIKLQWLDEQPCGDKTCITLRARRTFEERAAGRETYLLYLDPQSDRLTVQAYVARGDTVANPGVAETQAITYEAFADLDGVTLATQWRFWPWRRDRGPCGDYIGTATLDNLAFVVPDETTFAVPQDAYRVPPPPAEPDDELSSVGRK